MIKITKKEILHSELINSDAKKWAYKNMVYLNKPMNLFGTSIKVKKGSEIFNTYVLYLQPATKVANKTLCIGANASGCEKPCLILSGQLGMSVGQNAATKRTLLWLLRPEYFNNKLLIEVDRAERKALKTGIPALFRPNGTSDIDFSHLISARPNSKWYDYTKIIARMRKNKLKNYDLTFSASMYSKQSKTAFKKAIKSGYRVAVAFNTKLIASDKLVLSKGMASFDNNDIRPLDKNVIGSLTRKGSNIAQRLADDKISASFFVTSANKDEFNEIIALKG